MLGSVVLPELDSCRPLLLIILNVRKGMKHHIEQAYEWIRCECHAGRRWVKHFCLVPGITSFKFPCRDKFNVLITSIVHGIKRRKKHTPPSYQKYGKKNVNVQLNPLGSTSLPGWMKNTMYFFFHFFLSLHWFSCWSIVHGSFFPDCCYWATMCLHMPWHCCTHTSCSWF